MTDSKAGHTDNAAIVSALAACVAEQMPAWLPSQRWFGDKGRAIAGVEVVAFLGGRDGEPFTLTVVRVHFVDGEPAFYFLPLAVDVALTSETPRLSDATTHPQFGRWLMERFLEPSTGSMEPWQFVLPGTATTIAQAQDMPAVAMGAEQSNTSLRFDEALIVKLFRRLQPGPNPDEETLQALSTTSFTRAPAFFGSASWRAPTGADYPLALIQAFVPNHGDGWSWMLGRLAAMTHEARLVADFAPERRLGQRTGELHLALASITAPSFAPESLQASFAEEQIVRAALASREAAALIAERAQALPPTISSALPDIIEALRNPLARVDGFRAEIGGVRARVHGDYHLGQTLRTLDDDWEIIDFEGEPARPVSERRQKVSALKDVAGMLRSFAYARGAAERAASTEDAAVRLAQWERGARRAFISGYRDVLAAAGLPLAPNDNAAFARATGAWEFDKAVYEIVYEARNRPEWLEIPLRSLLPDRFAQASDATGAAPA